MLLTAAVAWTALAQEAANWPQFRGPNGLGIAPDQPVPLSFDGKKGENLRWKTRLPMGGYSSPVVWGDKVFVTGGDLAKRVVYCLHVADGRIAWQQEIEWCRPKPKKTDADPQEMEEEPTLKDNVAANTPATDGRGTWWRWTPRPARKSGAFASGRSTIPGATARRCCCTRTR
jgi:hypothetical protein